MCLEGSREPLKGYNHREDTIRFGLCQPHVDSAKDGLERKGKKGGTKSGGTLLGFQHGQIKGSRQIQKSLKE